MTLETFFAAHPRVALGFSGGADSAYLLYAGHAAGAEIGAYYVKSVFQPQFELDDAQRLCRALGVTLHVVEADVLAAPGVAENPPDRCYHCKRAVFGALLRQAEKDGYSECIDGTNASDDASDRPGFRALGEMRVLSPLRLCGITKQEVRARSRAAGLFTWNKPAYACLATRVRHSPITADDLSKVERAEQALKALGFSDFRVRVDGENALVQVLSPDAARAKWREITAALAPLFAGVALDSKPREASL
ncbi:MAG: ATP-dependent sacrificial sulfur transferase LarE [Oscillospiraceae bacterium]|nr:ATP-dependent sacrificial sulfur transferase LarE [Oscillospiraceae bacterium]